MCVCLRATCWARRATASASPCAASMVDDVRMRARAMLVGTRAHTCTHVHTGVLPALMWALHLAPFPPLPAVSIAACSVGAATTCLSLARDYTQSRKQFGKPLAANQAVQFMLADMATRLRASRLMVHDAAKWLDAKHDTAPAMCAMAKRFATDACFDVCNDALQLHGGYGYLQDYPIERFLRDVRVHQILEGTNQIMSVIVARALLQK
ncbi:hypothetical protein EON67_03695 [archaeon]|nr:MAG: hypothetical protein EON67_03695 [archaeon]